MRLPRVALAIVVYGHLSNATPQSLFPLNSQVPPVARPSHLFTFTFAPSTFSADLPNTYSLSNAPGWLSLDSDTRTLSGMPTPEDADLNISITASDETGSVTMNSELVVRTEPAPTVQIPLESQSASFGTLSGPSTVLYYPSYHFEIKFAPGTFMGNGSASALNYYAVSQDNTPLPSWVSFDPGSLTFSGETPDSDSLIQPPEIFGIQLIASDVEGFAGATITFNIAVGNHILAFGNSTIEVKGEGGKTFQYEGLSGDLKLEGQVISPANLTSINAQMPSWLAFDNSTFILSGTPPTDASSCNVTVTAVDLYGDTASVLLTIDFSTELFAQNTTQLNATIGEYFSHDLMSLLLDPSDVMTTAQFEPNTPWLSFDSNNMTLSGQVPIGIQPSTVRITLQASSNTTPGTQSMVVILNVISGIMPPSSSVKSLMTSVLRASSTSSTTSTVKHDSSTPTSSNTQVPSEGNEGSKSRLSRGEIAAIVVPLVLLLLAVFSCIFWICCHRRNRRGDGAKSPAKSDISGPVPVISPSHVPELGASHQALSRPAPRRNHTVPASGGATFEENAQRSRQSNTIRKSQTMSNLSGTRTSHLAESNSSGNRGRSFSENASADWTTLSTQYSRRRTQDSAFPPFGSRPNSSRATRNFSRKTRTEQLKRDDTSSNMVLYRGPSTKSKNSSIQQTPEHNYDPIVYMPNPQSFCQHPGTLIRHDSQDDADEFESGGATGGFGQGALSRSTTSWLTNLSAGGDHVQNRESMFSAQTQDTGLLFDSISVNKNDNRRSIRMVPTSPQAPPRAHLSTIEASPRTVYKPSRSGGGGSFFLGGSRSSSRTHRSPSLRSGYAASLRAYSSNNSPALPAPVATKWNEGNSKLLTPIQQPKPGPSMTQLSSIERMVSAAGLRSDNDTPDQRIGLGIGHGRIIDSPSERVRHSFLSNLSNRLSRTFQNRTSKQSFTGGNETDTESQFQAAEEEVTPRKSLQRHEPPVSQLDHTAFQSDNESGDSSDDEYEDESPENSIVEEYVRNSLASSYAATQPYNAARTSFTARWSKGVPIEYSQDEESPTLGQGTLGEIQRVVVTGKNSRDSISPANRGGESISTSPLVAELRERVVAMREKIGTPSSGSPREGIGLGLGLGWSGNETGRIVGGRGKRPVSIAVDGNGSPRDGDGVGVHRKVSNIARHYEFGDDDGGDENAVEDGNVGRDDFETASAFL